MEQPKPNPFIVAGWRHYWESEPPIKPQPFFIGRWYGVRVIASALTAEEIARAFDFAKGISYGNIPDRHADYLPLNLWDETPD